MYIKAIFVSKTTVYSQRKIQRKNILFVIAHPDDEAMFFTPTILELRKHNTLFLLCLSNGGFDGLGKVREKEMEASGKHLGFQEVQTLDHPDLQDGMKNFWETDNVAKAIQQYLVSKQGEMEINIIVTFDETGVSSHPNHIAVYRGVSQLFEKNQFQFDVLTLRTVGVIRKYIGYFDIYSVMPDCLNYFCLTPKHAFTALSVHHSQFVWFRKLFTIFSRYAYLNSLDHYTHHPEQYGEPRRQ
eukprot:403362824